MMLAGLRRAIGIAEWHVDYELRGMKRSAAEFMQ
jgi:hypothetical protein